MPQEPGVLDETPAATRDIDAVMAAQTDLVDPDAQVHTPTQVVCVKGSTWVNPDGALGVRRAPRFFLRVAAQTWPPSERYVEASDDGNY